MSDQIEQVLNHDFRDDQQKAAFDFCKERVGSGISGWMGCGKTYITLRLLNHWHARRVLVLCPKASIGTWVSEMQRFSDIRPLGPSKSRSTKKQSVDIVKHIMPATRGNSRAYICTFGSSWRKPLCDSILSIDWDAIIVDESQFIKSYKSKQSSFAYLLTKEQPDARKLALTGTPFEASPTDIYGAQRFFAPESVIISESQRKSWLAFENQFTIKEKFPTLPVPIVTGYQNLDRLKEEYFLPNWHVIPRETVKCPQGTHVKYMVDLPATEMKKYKEFEKESVVDIKGHRIIADNPMVRNLKMLQMCSGYVKDEFDEQVLFSDAKNKALSELLALIPKNEHVIVFSKFSQSLECLHATAKKMGRVYREISGKRKDGLTEYSKLNTEGCDMEGVLCGVQIDSGGAGVDLTAASTAIYMSTGHVLGRFEQSYCRLQRPGQKYNCRFIHMHYRGTIEAKVFYAISVASELNQKLLGSGQKLKAGSTNLLQLSQDLDEDAIAKAESEEMQFNTGIEG